MAQRLNGAEVQWRKGSTVQGLKSINQVGDFIICHINP